MSEITFVEFRKSFQKNFEKLIGDVDHLFVMDADPDELYNVYLDSFPPNTNNIYRERREFDCSACRSFIKRFGNVVVVKNGIITTLWKFTVDDPKYQTVINAMDKFVKSKPITSVYVGNDSHIGTNVNYEQTDEGNVLEWYHLYLNLPSKFVYAGSASIDTVKGNYRAIRDVFNRSLEELSLDSIDAVLELINSNTLYKGEEWKSVLTQFRNYKVAYDKLFVIDKGTFSWEKSVEAGPVIGKIRNHSIGTLLIDITAGMDLDTAVSRYEAVVAPTNYKRPKAIFTKQMLEDAKKTVEELGYMGSLNRRHATLDDISVNNILFANRDASKRITGESSAFDELQSTIAVDPKAFSRVEEVPIDKFIKDILPTTKNVEVFLENKLAPNMVSLIAPVKSDAPSMFKWNNAFSWAYAGNITDSTMKENVKMAGGNVEGVLRFSIQWNADGTHDTNDLDAHCLEPDGNHISFRRRNGHLSTGMLDVDIIHPQPNVAAVENITWANKSKMSKGIYKFYVNNYNHRGGKGGFTAEIEFDGQIFEFSYNKEVRQSENVMVAEVTFDGNEFTLHEKLPSTTATRDVWGMKTNQFIPVNVIMYSPNYWDEQEGVGHRHVFFMLKDCVNDTRPNGFFNEYLKHDLEKHKRVFEDLGSKMAVEVVEDQLSGVGLSTTKRGSVIVKVVGSTERVMKVMF